MARIPSLQEILNLIDPRIREILSRRPIVTYSVAGALLLLLILYVALPGSSAKSDVTLSPVRGTFLVTVTVSGELQAKNSINVMGPEDARQANIWQMKLSNLIPEGTVVKKGDVVAQLDKSEIAGKFKESQLSVQKLDAQFLQTVLDSALTLSQARDELVNLSYTVEEKRLALEQSAYEAPAMKRQAEIEFERAKRGYEQAKLNYVTKRKQSGAKAQAAEADLMKEKQHLAMYQKAMEEFTIRAPADGMVIYAREWNGKKKVVGSTINAWDPTVATLPDLREMESITYVSELDIQKLAVGQKVALGLDADPTKKLTGAVVSVANIGEQRPNSDSKVFEVRIKVNESDTLLRPAMTTSNEILVAKQDSVLSVPLECVHTEGGVTFVYRKSGGSVVRQEVKTGLINENATVILAGVTEREVLLMTTPPDAGKFKMVLLGSPL
ncbi:MAG TPA: HlyD family efflux transporter periplasmic adaptor subunit [Bacteroidota bacterium]|nr:HlyD family efflux transporter periplasmic adaptor subunit [Bacteroidota bacterium]